jgi:hypothetical protein
MPDEPTLASYGRAGTLPWPQIATSPTILVTVAASTSLVLAYNPARRYLLVVNSTGNTGWLGIGENAGNGYGIPILPFGSYEMTQGAGNVDAGSISIYGTGTFIVKEGI